MRNVKISLFDQLTYVPGETVAGFYVHRGISRTERGGVSVDDRWVVTEPNSGKYFTVTKSREAARNLARELRKHFDACNIPRVCDSATIRKGIAPRVEQVRKLFAEYR